MNPTKTQKVFRVSARVLKFLGNELPSVILSVLLSEHLASILLLEQSSPALSIAAESYLRSVIGKLRLGDRSIPLFERSVHNLLAHGPLSERLKASIASNTIEPVENLLAFYKRSIETSDLFDAAFRRLSNDERQVVLRLFTHLISAAMQEPRKWPTAAVASSLLPRLRSTAASSSDLVELCRTLDPLAKRMPSRFVHVAEPVANASLAAGEASLWIGHVRRSVKDEAYTAEIGAEQVRYFSNPKKAAFNIRRHNSDRSPWVWTHDFPLLKAILPTIRKDQAMLDLAEVLTDNMLTAFKELEGKADRGELYLAVEKTLRKT